MNLRRLHRRDVLKALGGIAGALPILQSLDAAADPTFPRRLVVFFHPNGVTPRAWFPAAGGSETNFTLGPVLQPLNPFKEDLLVFQGINMDSSESGPGEPHQRGMGSVLTGTRLQMGTMVGGDGTQAGWADGISVDQEIANAIGGETRFRSVQLDVRTGSSEVRHRISYEGPARPLPTQDDPRQVFQQLFSGLSLEPDEVARMVLRRRSVLDKVRGQFVSLRSRISTADRAKLDAHLTLVRDMERRLSLLQPSTAVCRVPGQPPDIEAQHEDNMAQVARLQADLLVMALACDLTRVASLQHSSGSNNIRFTFMQSYTDDHQLSHAGEGDSTSINEWNTRHRWYAQQFAHLIGRLKAIPEGGGTMLDNTAVLWVSDLAQGNTHSHKNMPFLLAGKCGGAFRTGRHLSYTDRRHNDLLLALLAAMGVPRSTFGDPTYCTTPLDLAS